MASHPDRKLLKKQKLSEKDEEISYIINNNVMEMKEDYYFDINEKTKFWNFIKVKILEKKEENLWKKKERLEIILDFILQK